MREDLTAEERKAVAALKRIAKSWPKSLLLYARGGSLHICRLEYDGYRDFFPDGFIRLPIDPASLPNDGGDR